MTDNVHAKGSQGQRLPNRDQILVTWNETAAEYPARCIHELFEEQVERTPNAVALIEEGRSLSYQELNGRANQLAHHLRVLGVGREVLVGLCMTRNMSMVVGILGILKAGGAYVPLDPNYPQERLAFMLEDTQVPVLLTQKQLLPIKSQQANVICLDSDWEAIAQESQQNPICETPPADLAYCIYTSGSTGQPKGVMIHHKGLVNYVWWAQKQYSPGEKLTFPLFSSLSFDLTVTSIYVPLITGGQIVIYGEQEKTPDLAILRVIKDNLVDIIKLTPSHLSLLKEMDLSQSKVRKLIVGGEDFKRELAQTMTEKIKGVEIYNEYGPTETVVGCMIHQYDPQEDRSASVPIGKAADNVQIYLLDQELNPVPVGAVGEIYISGDGVARGYLKRPHLSAERFVANPFLPEQRMYRTGDLGRWESAAKMQFLGRIDHQVKIQGVRIELGEIEAALLAHSAIGECVVNVTGSKKAQATQVTYCVKCGLPSTYPDTTFDPHGVCNICSAFDRYKDKVQPYFKTMADLRRLFEASKASPTGEYDCLMLLSGGKDSTYVLYQLVEMGLKVFAFTLDNDYISEEAKANIRRVVDHLGVDHIFGTTPFMKQIFADSLQRYSNVCNGCFKTIYTLAMNLAVEKGIKYIVTGLSRGQLFETRLHELYKANIFDVDEIDEMILSARKVYHRTDDLISRVLNVQIFQNDGLFNEIQFIDFYRYLDVELSEMISYLDKHAPWIRPTDTGRSTNCLINDIGIYIHQKERGYHNYALPYSWDVRLGHKTRDAALEELHDNLNHDRVKSILSEIGYDDPADTQKEDDKRLIAYYVSDKAQKSSDLRTHLSQTLPAYMIPAYFVRLDEIPLTPNGKVDRKALPTYKARPDLSKPFVAPTSPIEKKLAGLWAQALGIDQVGIHDNFIDVGGNSLLATQVISRVRQAFQVDLSLNLFFKNPTVANQAKRIEIIHWTRRSMLASARKRGVREEGKL